MRADVRGDDLYGLLSNLTTPIVAVTTTARGRRNGLIVNSAQRASLVPSLPRVSLYVSKLNVSHDMIYGGGVLALHLLRRDQWDVVEALGLRSARDVPDKLEALSVRAGRTGCPVLEDCYGALECRVVNAMDAGAATFFLADVVSARAPGGAGIMTSEYFRANAPAGLRRQYEERRAVAQRLLEPLAGDVDPSRTWPGEAPED